MGELSTIVLPIGGVPTRSSVSAGAWGPASARSSAARKRSSPSRPSNPHNANPSSPPNYRQYAYPTDTVPVLAT